MITKMITTTGVVQGPKWQRWASIIERYCFSAGIELLRIRSVPCGSDWLDSLLNTAREDVYFDIRGDLKSLQQMKNWLIAQAEKSQNIRSNGFTIERNPTMAKTNWYCEAKVTYWDRNEGDYCEVDLDHYSKAETMEEAEDEARESWSDHGYNPDRVTVKKYE